MNKIQLVSFVCTLFFFSCKYSPSGTYEVTVQPVSEAPEIEVDLNIASDTLLLPVNRDIKITYTTHDSEVRYVVLLFNDGHDYVEEGKSGTFYLKFNNNIQQKNTPYSLTIQLFRSSGSGSLADKFGMEGFLYQQVFTVIFLESSDLAPQVTKAYPQNGSMKIEWEKFKGVGFKAYHVFNTEFYKIDIITDQNITEVYDPTYVGYVGSYHIVTECESDSYRSQEFNMRSPLPVANAKQLSNGKTEIRWNQTKYKGNVLAYRIYEYYSRSNYLNEIAYVTDLNDTTLIYDKTRFAVKTRFFIEMVAKELIFAENYWKKNFQNYTGETEDYLLGNKIPIIPDNFFHNPPGKYCYYSNWWLYKYDTNLQQITDSIEQPRLDFAITPDGQRMLTLNSGTSVDILATSDFSKLHSLEATTLPENKLPYRAVLSNTNTGVLVSQTGRYFFYDFLNNKELSEFANEGQTQHSDKMKISNDGNFFCATHWSLSNAYSAELYEYKNASSNLIWKADNVKYFGFDPVNNYFIYFRNNKLTVMDLPSFTEKYEIEIADNFVFDIDWNQNEFLSLNNERDMFSIRDIQSGEIKKQIPTFEFGAPAVDYHAAFLSNKTLFISGYPTGLSLKLDY